ncbi:protein FAM107B isoform X1 [Euwallacea similis]|uniref:protein FAM107B isoform X1 n=1 Tax=Euwallacea similis TaxID=1736056 RepID=UPI00344EA2C2
MDEDHNDLVATNGNREISELPHKHLKEEELQESDSKLMFSIGEYGKIESNSGVQKFVKNSTVEELKLKLEKKELLFKPRSILSSPSETNSPTRQLITGEGMIPETKAPHHLTDDGLIAPRKPANPVREDPGRQNLHRELRFNQKMGKSVLNQKSELQRALEKHKDNAAKKQLEHHIAEKTPELEKVIADRARRLEGPPKQENEEDKVINKEFLQARMKLKKSTKDPK